VARVYPVALVVLLTQLIALASGNLHQARRAPICEKLDFPSEPHVDEVLAVLGPVVHHEPVHRMLVEPAVAHQRINECRDIALPVQHHGDARVLQAADVTGRGIVHRDVPELLQEALALPDGEAQLQCAGA
jgi:hypothetical protein